MTDDELGAAKTNSDKFLELLNKYIVGIKKPSPEEEIKQFNVNLALIGIDYLYDQKNSQYCLVTAMASMIDLLLKRHAKQNPVLKNTKMDVDYFLTYWMAYVAAQSYARIANNQSTIPSLNDGDTISAFITFFTEILKKNEIKYTSYKNKEQFFFKTLQIDPVFRRFSQIKLMQGQVPLPTYDNVLAYLRPKLLKELGREDSFESTQLPQNIVDELSRLKVFEKNKNNTLTLMQMKSDFEESLRNGYGVLIGIDMDDLPRLPKGALYWDSIQGAGTPGKHALIIVGYKKIGEKYYFLVKNSYGPESGYLGYAMLEDLVLFKSLHTAVYIK